MTTALPRREGDAIRIPVVVTGEHGERGEGSAVIAADDPDFAAWDAHLKAQGEPDMAKSARAVATGHEGDAERLHHYWTAGEGLAKWTKSPHPWTALYHHLLKHIKNEAEAKATAAAWYHDVFHTWPGAHHGGHK